MPKLLHVDKNARIHPSISVNTCKLMTLMSKLICIIDGKRLLIC